MWLGVRTELPWIDRLPREIICERVRLTLQALAPAPVAEVSSVQPPPDTAQTSQNE